MGRAGGGDRSCDPVSNSREPAKELGAGGWAAAIGSECEGTGTGKVWGVCGVWGVWGV